MFDEQVRVIAAGPLLASPMVPGAVTEGDQVWPPSKLTSVNTSKKLLMRKSAAVLRTLVLPMEALLGLSRTMMPPGSVPPERFNDSISVSKKRVLPVSKSARLLTPTLTLAGAENGVKVAPPFREIWPVTLSQSSRSGCRPAEAAAAFA